MKTKSDHTLRANTPTTTPCLPLSLYLYLSTLNYYLEREMTTEQKAD
jgi:hypothetical protein